MKNKTLRSMKTMAVFMSTGDPLSQYFDNIFQDNEELRENTKLFKQTYKDFIEVTQKVFSDSEEPENITEQAKEYGTWWDKEFGYSAKTESTRGSDNIGECLLRSVISTSMAEIVGSYIKETDDLQLQTYLMKIKGNLENIGEGFKKGLEHYAINEPREEQSQVINKAMNARLSENTTDDEMYALSHMVRSGSLPTEPSTRFSRAVSTADVIVSISNGVRSSDMLRAAKAGVIEHVANKKTLTAIHDQIGVRPQEQEAKKVFGKNKGLEM